MARKIERLTALGVAKLRAPGYHADGAGLYLQIAPSGSKSWIFRFKIAGRAREMGLGSLTAFQLADARHRARDARQHLADGLDPIEQRNEAYTARRENARVAARALTFGQAADRYIEAHEASWKNAKHAYQWRQTIETYAKPSIGEVPIANINTDLVLQVLEPIWKLKTETATRLRGRIEKILDWAKALKHREGDLPEIATGLDMAKFKDKARQFLRANEGHLALQRLRRGQPLTPTDVKELERMLADAGGSAEQIKKAAEENFGLGIFIRSLVGMEREAVSQAFSGLIAGTKATPDQIEFIELIVSELTANGAMEARRLY